MFQRPAVTHRISYVLRKDENRNAHLLGVNALALDTTTPTVNSPVYPSLQDDHDHRYRRRSKYRVPGGILYTGGRDGMIAAWDLHFEVRFRSRSWTTQCSFFFVLTMSPLPLAPTHLPSPPHRVPFWLHPCFVSQWSQLSSGQGNAIETSSCLSKLKHVALNSRSIRLHINHHHRLIVACTSRYPWRDSGAAKGEHADPNCAPSIAF